MCYFELQKNINVGFLKRPQNLKDLTFTKGAFTYDVRCFGGIFDLPTLIRYFTT